MLNMSSRNCCETVAKAAVSQQSLEDMFISYNKMKIGSERD